MEGRIGLWAELIEESESVSEPLFLECLQSGDSNRIFDRITDEDLKTILGVVNKLLNDRASRSKGMIVLERLLKQVNIAKFTTFQDSLVSAFHMILKDIDSPGTLNILANIIPVCKLLSEVNQTITSTAIPKILSYICEDVQETEPSVDELSLLKICLVQHHGPCGSYRAKLEKRLLLFIDHPNVNINEVLPLLSSAGGGGVKGDKHGSDWHQMVMKVLYAAYETLLLLYSDACPILEEENPFDLETSKLTLPPIKEQKVFLRILLLKNRLVKLSTLLASYLSTPFMAPKPIPYKSILRLISSMNLVNPLDLLRKSEIFAPKELYFLASLLPSIHEVSFKLLRNLIISVGTNLFPDAARIEQLIVQELNWMKIEQQSYTNLKIEIYRTTTVWLKATKNCVTSPKVGDTIVGYIFKDIQIESDTVRLSISSGGGARNKKAKKSLDFAAKAVSNEASSSSAIKDAQVTKLALVLLQEVIPSLDQQSYLKIYTLVSKTIVSMTQSGIFPPQYDNPSCRIQLFNCVLSLALNPNPKSHISLGLLTKLSSAGLSDPAVCVSTVCKKILSTLERLIHPICPSMDFVTVMTSTVWQDNSVIVSNETTGHDEIERPAELFEASCQTEADFSEIVDSSFTEIPPSSLQPAFDTLTLKKMIAEAIRDSVTDITAAVTATSKVSSRNDNEVILTYDSRRPTSPASSFPLPTTVSSQEIRMTNGNSNCNGEGEGKRKSNDESNAGNEAETQKQLTAKRQKTSEESADINEMLSSFVDIGCHENE